MMLHGIRITKDKCEVEVTNQAVFDAIKVIVRQRFPFYKEVHSVVGDTAYIYSEFLLDEIKERPATIHEKHLYAFEQLLCGILLNN